MLDSIKSGTPNSWEIKNMREGETLIQMEQKRTFEWGSYDNKDRGYVYNP